LCPKRWFNTFWYKVEIIEDSSYTRDYFWVKERDDSFILGWTDYIEQSVGEIMYLELIPVGTRLKKGDEFGSVETAKWVGKLYTPVSGRVSEINQEVLVDPALVCEAPFSDGWFIKITDVNEKGLFLSPQEYLGHLQSQEDV